MVILELSVKKLKTDREDFIKQKELALQNKDSHAIVYYAGMIEYINYLLEGTPLVDTTF